jgi:hypothetical protein
MNKSAAVKFEQFLKRELTDELKSVIVYQENGVYELFGKYVITSTNDGYYKVTMKPFADEHLFVTVKNAVTWCTFDIVKQYREANRVKELDLKIASIDFDITIHKRMVTKANDSDNKWIYIIKLQEDALKKKLMLTEINSYINTSKMLQAHRFSQKKQPIFNRLR